MRGSAPISSSIHLLRQFSDPAIQDAIYGIWKNARKEKNAASSTTDCIF